MNLKEYNEKKIFVTGVSGSGKTNFLLEYEKKYNINYFSFEDNWGGYDDNTERHYNDFIKLFPNEFITDAIPYISVNGRLLFIDYLKENKDSIKIICVCCTDKDEFENRIKSKFYQSRFQAYYELNYFYFTDENQPYPNLAKYAEYNIEYFDSYRNEFITKEILYERLNWINNDNIKKILKDSFMQYLDSLKYDKYYQDIESVNYIGYTKSSQTWENIKNLVDWKNKRVADLGCFHGYFSFRAAKSGAKVTGLEINDDVLKTLSYINMVEGNIIDIGKWRGGDIVSEDYDITLCLNVLHYFEDIEKSLKNIKSKTVIFETNQDLVPLIAKEFDIIKLAKSHRPDFNGIERIILLCEKKNNVEKLNLLAKDFWDEQHKIEEISTSSGCQYDETIDFLQIRENIVGKLNVLEIGVGLGYVTRGLKEAGMNVSAVDVSVLSLNKIKDYCENIYSIDELNKLPSNYYDIIICNNVVQHITTNLLIGELREFMRSLKPGGIFAVEFVSSDMFDDNGINPDFDDIRAGRLCRTPGFLEDILNQFGGRCKLVFDKKINISVLRGHHVFHVIK